MNASNIVPLTVPDLVVGAVDRDSATEMHIADKWSRCTPDEVDAASSRIAASLTRDHGVSVGQRVALLDLRPIQLILSMFGIMKARGVAVPISEFLPDIVINEILEDSEPAVVIVGRDRRRVLSLPSISFAELDQYDRTNDGLDFAPVPSDNAALLYTSGSTGRQKGVIVPHRNFVDGAVAVSEYLGLSPDDSIVSPLPLSFDYGLNQVMAALYSGAKVECNRYLLARDLVNDIISRRATTLPLVPPILRDILHTGGLRVIARQGTLKRITVSGGALEVATVERVRSEVPDVDLFLMYGLTEAFRSAFLDPREVDRRPASFGKAVRGVCLEVVRPDGTLAGANEVGELTHRGLFVAGGYWKDAELTRRVFRQLEDDGGRAAMVVHTGDFVRRDAEGYHYYLGRKDELVKLRGIRVSVSEVERVLCAAMGGRNVVACVRQEGDQEENALVVYVEGESCEVEDLKRCSRTVPGHMRPGRLVVKRRLPRTTTGKLDRQALCSSRGTTPHECH